MWKNLSTVKPTKTYKSNAKSNKEQVSLKRKVTKTTEEKKRISYGDIFDDVVDDDLDEVKSEKKVEYESIDLFASANDSFSLLNDTFDKLAKEQKPACKISSKYSKESGCYHSSSSSMKSDSFASPLPSFEMFPLKMDTSGKLKNISCSESIHSNLPLDIESKTNCSIESKIQADCIITSTPAAHHKIAVKRDRRNEFIPCIPESHITPMRKEITFFESSDEDETTSFKAPGDFQDQRFSLKPGKLWRRSARKACTLELPSYLMFESKDFEDMQAAKHNLSLLQCTAPIPKLQDNPRKFILQLCEQEEEQPLVAAFHDRVNRCRKIGEGIYGEVFMHETYSPLRDNSSENRELKGNVSQKSVLKLIPIEGELIVNGEKQKSFCEIAAEIMVSKALSDLKIETSDNCCSTFVRMHRCTCLKGRYTSELIDLWDSFKNDKGSENDRPDAFPDSQLYIMMEFDYAGRDVECFVFNNAMQAYAILMQVAYGLSVAERSMEFEHRDLHWGNVLVSTTSETSIQFKIDKERFSLKSYGVKATIIDFTLSRVSVDGETFFCDLSADPTLFCGQGDLQFEVYRKMKAVNGNDWKCFAPRTNVQWLHYLSHKMAYDCRYKKKTTKIHKEGMRKLKKVLNSVEQFESASKFVESTDDLL